MFSSRSNWNLQPNRLALALEKHRADGNPLLDLTISNPTVCGFQYDEAAILRAIANPAGLTYEPDPRGMLVAREAVSNYYRDRGDSVSASDIILTASTSEAYSFAFRTLCDSGDEILIPEPGYPLFSFLADIHDVRLVPYSLIYDHGWQIDFPSLHGAITPRTRAVVVVHPNNPTGHTCSDAEIAQLNQICASRQLAIIADEVFLDFSLTGKRARSFSGNHAALTFTTSGISKICGLPQLKAAWLAVSGTTELKSSALARLEVIADTYLSVGTPVQLALPELLQLRHSFQSQVAARIRINLVELDRQLAFTPTVTRLQVDAGWYAILRVPATHSDEDLAIALLAAHNTHVLPGHFFDLSPGHLVLSLIAPGPTFSKGIQVLCAL